MERNNSNVHLRTKKLVLNCLYSRFQPSQQQARQEKKSLYECEDDAKSYATALTLNSPLTKTITAGSCSGFYFDVTSINYIIIVILFLLISA